MTETMDVPNPLNQIEGGTPVNRTDSSRSSAPWEKLAATLDEPTRGVAHLCHKQVVKWSYFWLVVKESPVIHKAFMITVTLQSLWIVVSVSQMLRSCLPQPSRICPARIDNCTAIICEFDSLELQRIVLMVQALETEGTINALQWWYLVLMILSGWFAQSFALEAVVKANACELAAFFVVSLFLVIRDALR